MNTSSPLVVGPMIIMERCFSSFHSAKNQTDSGVLKDLVRVRLQTS